MLCKIMVWDLDTTKLHDQWPIGFCYKEEDRQEFLERIERSLYLASWNKALNDNKKNENDGNDSDSWWNVGVGWSSDGNHEDGDEEEEFSLIKSYHNKIDPRLHCLQLIRFSPSP